MFLTNFLPKRAHFSRQQRHLREEVGFSLNDALAFPRPQKVESCTPMCSTHIFQMCSFCFQLLINLVLIVTPYVLLYPSTKTCTTVHIYICLMNLKHCVIHYPAFCHFCKYENQCGTVVYDTALELITSSCVMIFLNVFSLSW